MKHDIDNVARALDDWKVQGTPLPLPLPLLSGGQPNPPNAKAVSRVSMRNPNTTKGKENLLLALANRRRVIGPTLPNSSGSMVCVQIMEYLDTI